MPCSHAVLTPLLDKHPLTFASPATEPEIYLAGNAVVENSSSPALVTLAVTITIFGKSKNGQAASQT